ncbi:diacylglycerol/lipid kinase family protein [Pseudoalteromonas sp. T1lg65]|uniref:diacylglycerol/lipid kinase family protein n=1 Tax=Pseudoalteromonas sp. T1lg65 TaxID=2077101 RepID=UPI003F7A0C34
MLVVVKPEQNRQTELYKTWLKAELLKRKLSVRWFFTSGIFEQDKKAICTLAKHTEQVVVIGGDGTIHLVVNAIAELDCQLAILPAGTGNDFCRQFLYGTEQWRAAVFSDAVEQVDVGRVNQRWFINIAGVGFNAHVVDSLQTGKRFGKLSYIFAGAKALFFAPNIVVDDNTSQTRQCMMMLVANGRFFAAGIEPAAMASLSSGRLEQLWFTPRSKWQRCLLFLRLVLKSHLNTPWIKHQSCQQTFIATKGLTIEADGEIVGVTPARFECHRGRIKLKKAPSA